MFGQLIGLITKLFTKPKEYWEELSTQPGDIKSLLVPRVLILAAAPTACTLVGELLGALRWLKFAGGAIIVGVLVATVLKFVINVGAWLLLGVLINAFSGTFGAQKDLEAANRLAFGAMIPIWLGGMLAITTIGALSLVGALGGLGYSCYLLYVGMPMLNGTPQEKAGGYVATVMAILLVSLLVLFALAACPVSCAVTSAVSSRYGL